MNCLFDCTISYSLYHCCFIHEWCLLGFSTHSQARESGSIFSIGSIIQWFSTNYWIGLKHRGPGLPLPCLPVATALVVLWEDFWLIIMDLHEVCPNFIDMNQCISKYLRNFQQQRRAATVFLYLRHQSFRSFDCFTQLKISWETLRVINLANDFYSFVYCCSSSFLCAEIRRQ